MPCPHCTTPATTELSKRTTLGYRTFRCSTCRHTFNERTGTPFNYLDYPTDIVLLVVLWRLRYTLSLRDLAEMFLERGFAFTHEAVREWEVRFAPRVADTLRAKRKGQVGRSWHVDETYIKVGGCGSTSTALSIERAIWSTRCAANTAIWTRPSASSRPPWRWLRRSPSA